MTDNLPDSKLPPRKHPDEYRYKIPPASPNVWQKFRARAKRRLAAGPLGRFARYAAERNIYLVGSNAPLCSFHPTANLSNAIINAESGVVTVEEYVFFGHGVQLLTGTHDVQKTGLERQHSIPFGGRDITIRRGAWVASNVTVIGPSIIGEDAVVCAGAVVIGDVDPGTMVGGIPAKAIKEIDFGAL